MKFKTILALFALLIFSSSPIVQANEDGQSKISLSTGWHNAKVKDETVSEKYDSLVIRITYRFTDKLAGEFETLFSFDSSGDISDLDLESDVSANSIFAKYRFPFGNSFEVHGRLGYVDARISVEIPESTDLNLSVITSDTGLSYGFGGAYRVSETSRLRFDWTRYDLAINHDGFSFSLVKDF